MKWDLTNYFKTYEDFKEGIKVAKEMVSSLGEYKGKLSIKEKFVEYYKKQIELENLFKVYLYAECQMDRDLRNTSAVSDMQEVYYILQLYSNQTSFEQPEVLSLGEEYVMDILDKNKEIEELRFSFKNLFRRKSHILGLEGQKVLANFSSVSQASHSLYGALTNSDDKEKYIKGENKEKVLVSKENWSNLIENAKTPKFRKQVYEAMMEKFVLNKNTYAAIYNNILQDDIAEAKSTNFNSALEMHLFRNNIPTSLYHNLIKIAHKAAPSVKKYLKIRKNILGLKSYHTYDRFMPLAPSSTKKYTYEDAKKLFLDSIDRFPTEFKEFAKDAVKDGYVDVYPSTGKRGGAYSNSTANTHPCILLNFTETLDDCFTLAHEAGHSTHSLFSNKYQPTTLQSYTIFVAEIASTFNEQNLLDYLINKGELSKDEKINLLQKAIDSIMGTFIRQTLFAEYEYIAHTKAENGEPITEESLSKIMIDLYKKYYGLDIRKEKVKQYVWAYIPHFFNSPYYVYQYATSFSASLAIYQNVKEGKEGAFDNYLELLKSGGSDYPINLVKKAGVDFTKMDALNAVNRRLENLIVELEKAQNE